MSGQSQTNGNLALESQKVIVIEAAPKLEMAKLQVAAYCRASSDSTDQLNSFMAQLNYYTTLIGSKENWTLADLYVDEGISGASAERLPDFQRLLLDRRRGRVSKVLVKSISRFARNTVDCLKYMRALKELGIAIIFEEQNLNTLDNESELMFTLMSAFAQAESESISENVKWGKRQAMREGKAVIQYKRLYAYEKGEDGKPRIIPEQAEVVRLIYDSCLAGHSLDMIREKHGSRLPCFSLICHK